MRVSTKVTFTIFFLFSFFILLNCSEGPSIQPDPVPEAPIVNIVSPTDNSSIGGLINIIVSATDNKGVVKVEIYIDNETNNLRTLLVEPFEYLWDASSEPNNSQHTIYAKAYDGDENVSSSEVITVTKVTIESPTNLIAELKGDSAVVFSWIISNPSEFSFVLQESVNSGGFKNVFETQIGELAYTLSKGYYTDSSYLYRVLSKKDEILSSASNTQYVSVIFPGPTNLIANIITSTILELWWNDNSNFEKGYIIKKSVDAGSFHQIASLPHNTENFIDHSFNETESNAYTVAAFSNYNVSDSALIIINRSPVISNTVIEPDTVIVDTTIIIFTSVEADDPDGNDDIDKVYFIVYRPDRTTSGVKTFLFDDGNPTNGDAIAGDGIYSRLIQVDETNDKGTYRFEFQAEDKQGSLSNIINHFALIL